MSATTISDDCKIGLIACVCTLLLVIYTYVTRNFKYWTKLGVKQLKPSFPFGSFGDCLFLKKSIHEFIDYTYNKAVGEKMIGFYVFDKPYLLLRDPELLKFVFIKDFNVFTNKLVSNNKSDPFGTHTLFLVSNPPWKRIRQGLSPMFTSGKFRRNFELMMEICKDLEFHLDQLGVNEKSVKPIEVRDVCANLMADMIGMTSYNLKFNSLTDPKTPFSRLGKAFSRSHILRYVQFLSILFVPQLRPITRGRFFDIGTEFFESTFIRIVEERIQSGDRKNDFVDLIVDLIKSEDSDCDADMKVGRRVWMTQLSGIFIAGFETSATTTSFALYQVALNQDVQTRLRNELFEASKATDGKLTYDVVTKSPYLNMVVREILRMYPILTWVDRLADADYTFPGTSVTVKKGTPVIFPIHSIHMDSTYFPDPDKFDPERFSDNNKDQIVPFTYAPFGEGPRNCVGGRLGVLQVKVALAYFVTHYEITPCDETLIPLEKSKINVIMSPAGKIYLNFKRICS